MCYRKGLEHDFYTTDKYLTPFWKTYPLRGPTTGFDPLPTSIGLDTAPWRDSENHSWDNRNGLPKSNGQPKSRTLLPGTILQLNWWTGRTYLAMETRVQHRVMCGQFFFSSKYMLVESLGLKNVFLEHLHKPFWTLGWPRKLSYVLSYVIHSSTDPSCLNLHYYWHQHLTLAGPCKV